MSKVKKEGATHYEILYIVPNNFTEDEAKKIDGNVKKLIEDNGGKITYEEFWGKKKLAYPINHFNHGYYTLYEFDMDGINLVKLDKALKLSNEVLRHQIIVKKKQIISTDIVFSIKKYIKENNIDLLLMNKKKNNHKNRIFTKSLRDRILKDLCCAVVLVNGNSELKITKKLIKGSISSVPINYINSLLFSKN